jgi:hypothetical protein
MFSLLMWIPSWENYTAHFKTSYGASILLAMFFLVGNMAEKWTLLREAEMIPTVQQRLGRCLGQRK